MSKVSVIQYSLAEELISAISHGVGFGLGVAGGVLCIVKAAKSGNPWAIVSASIFAFTLMLLYAMSTIYHSLSPRLTAKKVLRVIDHCSVFILIAGTYTPYLLVSLRGVAGWVMFGIIWGLCILGVVFNALDVDKYQAVSAVINVLMGWAICFQFSPLIYACGKDAVVYLITGGVLYTLGAILYALGHKVKFTHSIFHFFCLAGSIMHFLSIYLYVL